MVPKMLPMEFEIREYVTLGGVSPFANWRRTLDPPTRARIDRVLERFVDGNFGDHKTVGEGVQEARIHTGPGYRIYFGLEGRRLVILLAGGAKGSQDRDVAKAKERWLEFIACKRRGEWLCH
jgi:putative addiction module killer protein